MTFRYTLVLALCWAMLPIGTSILANPDNHVLEVRQEILELFKEFEEYPRVCDSGVGAAGITPECYSIVHTIAEQATPKELVMLTRHEAPGVRANALIALLFAEQDELFLQVIPEHFHDSTRLTWESFRKAGIRTM
ncbi:MAG: hypothetical protein RH862_14160 [Leptospiraceae bacterium]